MILCRAALGRVFTVDARHGQLPGRWTAPPAGYDSVLADFQPNSSAACDPHPVDDPSVVLYHHNALYAGYLIMYAVEPLN